MNPFLKDILKLLLHEVAPLSLRSICQKLHEHEFYITSGLCNLEELRLICKDDNERYVLSNKGRQYISLSEIEQRSYEKKHPFLLYCDAYDLDAEQE